MPDVSPFRYKEAPSRASVGADQKGPCQLCYEQKEKSDGRASQRREKGLCPGVAQDAVEALHEAGDRCPTLEVLQFRLSGAHLGAADGVQRHRRDEEGKHRETDRTRHEDRIGVCIASTAATEDGEKQEFHGTPPAEGSQIVS